VVHLLFLMGHPLAQRRYNNNTRHLTELLTAHIGPIDQTKRNRPEGCVVILHLTFFGFLHTLSSSCLNSCNCPSGTLCSFWRLCGRLEFCHWPTCCWPCWGRTAFDAVQCVRNIRLRNCVSAITPSRTHLRIIRHGYNAATYFLRAWFLDVPVDFAECSAEHLECGYEDHWHVIIWSISDG